MTACRMKKFFPGVFYVFWTVILLVMPHGVVHADIPPLNIELSADHIDITTGFNGATLTLFGVRREPGDIVLVIRGPETALTVRRKDKVGSVWMNRESVTFNDVPVYYDLASSRPVARIAPPASLQTYKIGLDGMAFRYVGDEDDAIVDRFREALIRGWQARGLFPLDAHPIDFIDNNFFRVDFYLPPDVQTGIYTVDSYLFREGAVVSHRQASLRVAQVGFSARLYDFAHRQSVLYGLVAISLALAAGWGAHRFLRRE